ncbi:hypothetical protein LTR37_013887 [Vermiconidia calcicola]|uniref:Uncharacterized protein n=1 Tax=Vermiconidia calcicola TaxID=1690605 RepID=A0ACC3MWN5_9PEZI|nr:hypothetical protein LTR37_013887 [Vermiconidia calcicola]
MASRSASFDRRTRSEDSWVEISSQPSSSSLSSIGDEVITTGLRVQHDPRAKRRRTLRRTAPSGLNISYRPRSTGGASSQEEYEESGSESDRVMTSSNEGPVLPTYPSSRAGQLLGPVKSAEGASEDGGEDDDDDDDENRTAINNDQCFTPQPNAFSHPPTGQLRHPNQPAPGSYFPSQRRETRPTARPSPSSRQAGGRQSHVPQNILSPSYDAAAQHEEALRTSLSTLLSCAAAARSLGNTKSKQAGTAPTPQFRGNRVEPMNLRLLPESRLPASSPPQFQEPTFNPTLRRKSTSTSTSSEQVKENKRKAATGRSSSRERRALKKARRSTSAEDLQVSPTLLTWVVSAGVVVVLSALSFSAGYSAGKEAGRLEPSSFAADEQVRSCAREAGRSGLGLKRSLARSAVQV